MTLRAIERFGYAFPIYHEEQPENSLKSKCHDLLIELKKLAGQILDGKDNDFDRIRKDDGMTPKGQREKIRALQTMRVKILDLAIENSKVMDLITEGRSTLQSEHDEIFAPKKTDLVLDYLRGREIRDHLATFTDTPDGLSGDGKRFEAIENMIAGENAEGVRAVFNAPEGIRPVIRSEKLLGQLKAAWVESQNPGLLGRMADLRELGEVMTLCIGDTRDGVKTVMDTVPDLRTRLEAVA